MTPVTGRDAANPYDHECEVRVGRFRGGFAEVNGVGRANSSYREIKMGFVPIMLGVWGASFVFMAVVTMYAARVGRNEEAQIFLAESSSRVKSDQDAIQARVSKIRPVKMAALGIVGLMTVIVVGYYLFDIFHQF